MGPIEKIKGEISRRGLANPNRFTAKFGLPNYVTRQVPDLAFGKESLNILCESINFPGKQIETVDYSMYRNPLKVPSGFINDEVSVTFRLTEDFLAKRVFEIWQAGIIDQTTYKARYREDYVEDMLLVHQDKQDKARYSIKLIECYPITVGSIEKSHEVTDTTLRLTVTFACKDILADNDNDSYTSRGIRAYEFDADAKNARIMNNPFGIFRR